MKIKTCELEGAALDWAVAKCEGYTNLRPNPHAFNRAFIMTPPRKEHSPDYLYNLNYGSSWELAGPIIERDGIEILCNVSSAEAALFRKANPDWFACLKTYKHQHYHGSSPLIAAMRCYVASKLGDEVEIPDTLVR